MFSELKFYLVNDVNPVTSDYNMNGIDYFNDALQV